MSNSRQIFNVVAAAAYLGVHPNTIRRYVNDGYLPAFRLGVKHIRIHRRDLDALKTPVVIGEVA